MSRTFFTWSLLTAVLLLVAPREVWHACMEGHGTHDVPSDAPHSAADEDCLLCDLGMPVLEQHTVVQDLPDLPLQVMVWAEGPLACGITFGSQSNGRGPPMG